MGCFVRLSGDNRQADEDLPMSVPPEVVTAIAAIRRRFLVLDFRWGELSRASGSRRPTHCCRSGFVAVMVRYVGIAAGGIHAADACPSAEADVQFRLGHRPLWGSKRSAGTPTIAAAIHIAPVFNR